MSLEITTAYFKGNPITAYLVDPCIDVSKDFNLFLSDDNLATFGFKLSESFIALGIWEQIPELKTYMAEANQRIRSDCLTQSNYGPIVSHFEHINSEVYDSRVFINIRGLLCLGDSFPKALHDEWFMFCHQFSEVLEKWFVQLKACHLEYNYPVAPASQLVKSQRSLLTKIWQKKDDTTCWGIGHSFINLGEIDKNKEFISQKDLAKAIALMSKRPCSERLLTQRLISMGFIKPVQYAKSTRHEFTHLGASYGVNKPRQWHISVVNLILMRIDIGDIN